MSGGLRHRVAFDAPLGGTNTFGETQGAGWDEGRHTARAELIYQGGGETVEAARLAGRQAIKVKLRTCAAARAIGTGWRMRLIADGSSWDIKEADTRTQRAFVFLVVEGPLPA